MWHHGITQSETLYFWDWWSHTWDTNKLPNVNTFAKLMVQLGSPRGGGRPNTKSRDYGTPNAHNLWSILLYHARGSAWLETFEITFERGPNHIRLHTTLEDPWPHYMISEVCWDGLWTLSFGLSQFHGHSSWLVCEVDLREKKPENKNKYEQKQNGFMFKFITFFKFITVLCGTNDIPYNIPKCFPLKIWMWEYSKALRRILSIPQHVVMDMNNVMLGYFKDPIFFCLVGHYSKPHRMKPPYRRPHALKSSC